jgi:hypothetical protein
VTEFERRVLRAADEASKANNGNWLANDLIAEPLGGVEAIVAADALRSLQSNGYLRLEGAFGGREFVRLITAKGYRAIRADD